VLQSLDVKRPLHGLDGITAKCLYVAAPAIAGCLSYLFNLSLVSGVFPKDWKTARVTPIFKAGNRSDLNNYHTISILPVVAKVFERQVAMWAAPLTPPQAQSTDNWSPSGFCPGHSTQYLILKVVDDWRVSLHNYEVMFDSIHDQLLLSKLDGVGVHGAEPASFQSYLCDRLQCVCIGKAKSSHRQISSGVPQGSILGPLLFIVFRNNLYWLRSCYVRLNCMQMTPFCILSW